jgi:hypothetical protein
MKSKREYPQAQAVIDGNDVNEKRVRQDIAGNMNAPHVMNAIKHARRIVTQRDGGEDYKADAVVLLTSTECQPRHPDGHQMALQVIVEGNNRALVNLMRDVIRHDDALFNLMVAAVAEAHEARGGGDGMVAVSITPRAFYEPQVTTFDNEKPSE